MQPWFERTFRFDAPPVLLPNVVERLRGTPARVEEFVRALAPPTLTRRAGDRWTIHETVGHLLDLEPLWLGRVDDLLAGAPVLRPADLTNRATHEAGHHATPVEALLARFRTARGALVTRVEPLGVADAVRSARHPRLDQPMRLIDLLTFVAEHDDHHLAGMRALAQQFGGA